MDGTTRSWRAALIVPAAAALAAAGWSSASHAPARSPTSARVEAVDRDFRECPGPYWSDTITLLRPELREPSRRRRRGSTPAAMIPVTVILPHGVSTATLTTKVPEFHDCQRFITGNGAKYDSLFAIFASDHLDSLADSMAQIAGPHRPASIPADSRIAVVFAEVFTRGSYDKLGVKPGFNCLFMEHHDGGGWQAFMLPVGAGERGCLSVMLVGRFTGPLAISPPSFVVDTSRAKRLEVRRFPLAGFTNADYPAVARWDWHPGTQQYYISLKCGAAWCEVGLKGFKPSDPISVVSPDRAMQARHRIKGWYDQQWLAVPMGAAAPATGVTVIPAKLTGTAIPDTGLESRKPAEFTAGWVRVAEIRANVAVSGPAIVTYKSKLNLAPGANQLYLRQDPATGKWLAKVRSSAGPQDTVTFDVKRHDHTADVALHHFKIPGTVRWRWMPNDETIWARCLEGCCEVQAKGSAVSTSPSP